MNTLSKLDVIVVGLGAMGSATCFQLELARRHGAQPRLGERVEAWAASADGVIVRTDADTYEAQQLVL
jgi:sarcosine oxidase